MPRKRRLELREIKIKVDGPITHSVYPDNKLHFSPYTLFNFVPRNLFEQFKRISNI